MRLLECEVSPNPIFLMGKDGSIYSIEAPQGAEMSTYSRKAQWRRSLIGTFAAIVPWLGAADVLASTITVHAKTTMTSKTAMPRVEHGLRLTGMIEPGDGDRLRSILMKLTVPDGQAASGPTITIELSSKGGDLNEGFRIGFVLKTFKVVAVVRKGDICLSACALAFLGGAAGNVDAASSRNCNLEIGGKLAFHNFSLNRNGLREVTTDDPVASRLQGFNDARGGAAMLVGYAGEMGVPPKFIARIVGRPAEEFTYVDAVGKFLSLHMCPIGLERPSIPLAMQAANVCNHSTGWLDAAPLEAVAIPTRHAKRYVLEHLQANMLSFKVRGALADQLASAAVMRVKEAIDRLYEDLQAAGVGLPDIVGPTFEVRRRLPGGHETACYVSLSSDDPDRFDVVIQGPRGLSRPRYAPPGYGRRLFLFARDDVINPHP